MRLLQESLRLAMSFSLLRFGCRTRPFCCWAIGRIRRLAVNQHRTQRLVQHHKCDREETEKHEADQGQATAADRLSRRLEWPTARRLRRAEDVGRGAVPNVPIAQVAPKIRKMPDLPKTNVVPDRKQEGVIAVAALSRSEFGFRSATGRDCSSTPARRSMGFFRLQVMCLTALRITGSDARCGLRRKLDAAGRPACR